MQVIAREGRILIRKMEDCPEDFNLFLRWMTDPATMKYWQGMTERYTYGRVAAEYREQEREGITQCILEYDGAPIGFCQFCVLNAAYFEVPEELYARFAGEKDLVYGIDIFLGEAPYRNRGIGTDCLRALMRALFDDFRADLLLIDPKVHNARAIRCYQKCGFQEYFMVPHRELQDGIYHDSLILGVRREEFR